MREAAIRRVAIGRGWGWIAEAFGLFRRSPVIWIALHLVLLLIAFGLFMIPRLGIYLVYLLWPLLLWLGFVALGAGRRERLRAARTS